MTPKTPCMLKKTIKIFLFITIHVKTTIFVKYNESEKLTVEMILNETIFEGLYHKYSDRLYNFAFRFVSDERAAEDIVHEAYITLWEKFEGKDGDTWQALLFRLVRNRSIDTLRHQSALKVVRMTESFKEIHDEGLYHLDLAVSDSDKRTIYDELISNIREIMDKLPDRCREVFSMSRFQNLKNKEIASTLGISEKAVEKHIHKALTVFRKELDDMSRDGKANLSGDNGALYFWLTVILYGTSC